MKLFAFGLDVVEGRRWSWLLSKVLALALALAGLKVDHSQVLIGDGNHTTSFYHALNSRDCYVRDERR